MDNPFSRRVLLAGVVGLLCGRPTRPTKNALELPPCPDDWKGDLIGMGWSNHETKTELRFVFRDGRRFWIEPEDKKAMEVVHSMWRVLFSIKRHDVVRRVCALFPGAKWGGDFSRKWPR